MDYLTLGYLGLFIGTFLSATLLPFTSEGILVAFFSSNTYENNFDVFFIILIATLGNFLGGVTNYIIGYYASSEKLIKKFNLNKDKLKKWRKRLNKWGVWLGLISWLPIVGDPMVAVLGFYKVKIMPLSVLMFIGKLVRYIIIAYFYFMAVA